MVLPVEITKDDFQRTTNMTQTQLNLLQPPIFGGQGGPFGGC